MKLAIVIVSFLGAWQNLPEQASCPNRCADEVPVPTVVPTGALDFLVEMAEQVCFSH